MKLFNKSWVLLLAVGLVVGLAVQPIGALAGNLDVNTTTVAEDSDDIILNNENSCSTDGAEGDPDGLSDTLENRGVDLDEESLFSGGQESSSLRVILNRMVSWFLLL